VEAGRKLKLSIVDDEQSMLRVCEVAFESLGYEVSLFPDGMKFMESLAKGLIPDAVLLDVMMPVKSGYEICREIKNNAAYKNIKVIIYTALSGGAVKYESEKSGADSWVTKGIEMDKVSELIKSLL
jgi:two-component system, OmpR family, alkaline phosphatase synthesis response regulator PhoP